MDNTRISHIEYPVDYGQALEREREALLNTARSMLYLMTLSDEPLIPKEITFQGSDKLGVQLDSGCIVVDVASGTVVVQGNETLNSKANYEVVVVAHKILFDELSRQNFHPESCHGR